MSTKTFLSTVNFSKLTNWSLSHLRLAMVSFAYKTTFFKDVLSDSNIEWVNIEDDKYYPILGIRGQGAGVYINRVALGKELTMKKYQKSKVFHLFYCKVRTVKGQWGVVYPEYENSYGSSNMQYLNIDQSKITLQYLEMLLKVKRLTDIWDNNAIGADGRHFTKRTLLNLEIPLPSLEEQNKIVEAYNQQIKQAEQAEQEANRLEEEIENYIYSELGIQKQEKQEKKKGLQFVRFCKLDLWGIDKISNQIISDNLKYPTVSLDDNSNLYTDLFRGKSPKYEDDTKKFILNQKCNRWNEFELEHAKTVNETWFASIDENAFTREGDILINSTGEGTIGRSSCVIDNDCIGMIYDSHLLLLRLNSDLVNPLYYTLVFNSKFGQDQVNNIKSAQSTKQTELGVGNLKKIQIPLPPLSTQNGIVEHITSLKEQIKTLRHQAEQNRQQAIKDFENTIFN